MDGGLSLRPARVARVAGGWPGVQELEVTFDDGRREPALVLLDLLAPLAVGDSCLVNTTAVELGLGSGGYHIVVCHDGAASHQGPGGHLMKLRYTPFQLKVAGPEDPGDERHRVLERATDTGGMPVVCCELHSQVAPVAAAFRLAHGEGRLAYVMTDEGALPYRLSQVAGLLRRAGLLAVSVSAGQAFGADAEAATVHSALLMARHVFGADAAVVAIGPGLLGTGTPFGHGGIAQAEAAHAAIATGGRPVVVPRISFADGRERHRGLSHHSVTVLGRTLLAPVSVAMPEGLPGSARDALISAAGDRHRVVTENPGGWREVAEEAGIPLSSMGRGPDEDPWFFAAAAAAGALAGRWARHG